MLGSENGELISIGDRIKKYSENYLALIEIFSVFDSDLQNSVFLMGYNRPNYNLLIFQASTVIPLYEKWSNH